MAQHLRPDIHLSEVELPKLHLFDVLARLQRGSSEVMQLAATGKTSVLS